MEDPETRQSTSNVLKIQVDSTFDTFACLWLYQFHPLTRMFHSEVDSISLTRVRRELMPNIYFHRKTFGYGIDIDKKKAEQDSDSKTSDAPSKANGIQNRHNNGLLQRRVSESEIRTSSDDELPQPSSNTMRPKANIVKMPQFINLPRSNAEMLHDNGRPQHVKNRRFKRRQQPQKLPTRLLLTMKKQANPNK